MTERTTIFKLNEYGEHELGYLMPAAAAAAGWTIYRLRYQEGVPIGRADDAGRVFRTTQHDEREVGTFTRDGAIRSHGLFEGGELGWVEHDGVVIRGGLIFEEEEVGRVQGPAIHAAAAALLLIFLPEEDESNRRTSR